MIWKISPEIAIAEQLTLAQLQHLSCNGLQSILHLLILAELPSQAAQRFYTIDEVKAVSNQIPVITYTIKYKVDAVADEIIVAMFNHLHQLPKPALIYTNQALPALVLFLKGLTIQQQEISQQIEAHIATSKCLLQSIDQAIPPVETLQPEFPQPKTTSTRLAIAQLSTR